MCDEIINATDRTNVTNTIPANMTNTILTNVISTISINSDDKKVRHNMDRDILHMLLIVIIVPFTIALIYYHYT